MTSTFQMLTVRSQLVGFSMIFAGEDFLLFSFFLFLFLFVFFFFVFIFSSRQFLSNALFSNTSNAQCARAQNPPVKTFNFERRSEAPFAVWKKLARARSDFLSRTILLLRRQLQMNLSL